MRVVVGLGNPGEQYKNMRHNIGWLALDAWLGDVRWNLSRRFNALIHEDGEFLFVKPLSFMNNSGEVAQKILSYYKLLPKNFGLLRKSDSDLNDVLTVVHDELDLDFGVSRLATDSSSAGNRGVQSLIDHLKTKRFTRLRLGIKNPLLRSQVPPDKFVLQPFTEEEKKKLPAIFSAWDIKNLK